MIFPSDTHFVWWSMLFSLCCGNIPLISFFFVLIALSTRSGGACSLFTITGSTHSVRVFYGVPVTVHILSAEIYLVHSLPVVGRRVIECLLSSVPTVEKHVYQPPPALFPDLFSLGLCSSISVFNFNLN